MKRKKEEDKDYFWFFLVFCFFSTFKILKEVCFFCPFFFP